MLNGMTGQYCTGDSEETQKTETAEGYPGKTCRKALGVFYATCKEKGLDYTKPMPKKAEEGKFTFLVDSLIITEGVAEGVYKAHGFALHPVVTYHPGEPPRVYSAVKEELIKAAPTLKGKHLDIDHSDVPVNPDINIITDSKWNFEVEAVEFWAQIDDYLYELIQSGCPVSVSINWLIPDQGGIKVVEVDGEIGIAPYGFEFGDPGLSILQNMTPGDPNAMIELLMESVSRASINGDKKMKKKLKEQNSENPAKTGEPKTDKERFMAHFGIDEEAFQKLYDILGDELFKLLPERGQKTQEQDGEIKPGEDESKEDFIQRCKVAGNDEPHCQAIWDKAHPGTSTAEQLKEDSQITSDVCGVEPSDQGSSNQEQLLEAKVTELLARVDKLEKAHGGAQGNLSESLLKNSKEPTIKVTEAIKILEGLLPSPMVERSSMGMQRECQAIRGAILQLKEMLKSG